MKRWIRSIFADSRGEPSSKRTISIIAFVLLAIAFMMNLFTDRSVNEYMWDGMITLVIFGIGFVASEKFAGILSKKKDGNSDRSRPPYRPNPPYRGDDYTPGGNCDCDKDPDDEDESLMV